MDDFDHLGIGHLVLGGAFVEFVKGLTDFLLGSKLPGGQAIVNVALKGSLKFSLEIIAGVFI